MKQSRLLVVLAGGLFMGCEALEDLTRHRLAGAPSAKKEFETGQAPGAAPATQAKPRTDVAPAISEAESAELPVPTAGAESPAGGRRIVLQGHNIDQRARTEAWIRLPPDHVITGIGATADLDNITTLRIRMNELRPDGTLGPPAEKRVGWYPDRKVKANVDLPEGYVAVGLGAGVDAEWNITTLIVWARPLGRDGQLGELKEFRAGTQPRAQPQRKFICQHNRVLTSVGLWCLDNTIMGVWAESDEVAVE